MGCTPLGGEMSKQQLETFVTKASLDVQLKNQVLDCGLNNSCIVAVGKKYGHNFSPATVSHWQRDHRGGIFS